MDSRRLPNGSRWDEWGSTGEVAIDLAFRGHYVYVAWGADLERPLYVGKTRNFLGRMANHARDSLWYVEANRVELHAFQTAEDAELAEIEAIFALNPIHNRMRRMTAAQKKAALAEAERRYRAEKETLRVRAFQAAEKRAEREARRRVKAEARERNRTPSPWPRKRLRKGGDVFDIASPEQLEIIRRVQNRGRAA